MGETLATATELKLGGSAGLNVAGAYVAAKLLGPGKTIVTFLCDGGARYQVSRGKDIFNRLLQSKVYTESFLREKNLPVYGIFFIVDLSL